ncbi:pentatricopeptide repeat-containing protein At1g11290, chloroplastic [Selaginella moellendorffii]|nr:pentatricopeptide repeat-containing protein At1g11290, chloroplastic [Selaginella moellendorffii]|eukprot:XP_024537197.1 pentatricopeptide repeat-containing protein At1g11290, chloroplastic [Selaginella moellendorffii]
MVSSTWQWRKFDAAPSPSPPAPGIPAIASFIKHCSSNLAGLRKVHSQIKRSGIDSRDRYIGNLLIGAYSSHGDEGGIADARAVLVNLARPSVKSWNILIAACVRQGQERAALELYAAMNCEGRTRPDAITMVSILSACSILGELGAGKALHERILADGFDSNAIVATAVVTMYFKCSSIDRARKAFDGMKNRTVVSWNTMITAYAHRGDFFQAMFLFESMDLERDCFTYSAILGAAKDLKAGRKIHQMILASGIRLDVAAFNALVSMYVRGGSMGEAREAFESMTIRDIVSWNAMIAGYVQFGYGVPAIELYERMVSSPQKPNAITYASVLAACSIAGDATKGRKIHSKVAVSGAYDSSITVQNALVNFYAKCGSFGEAESVFGRMRFRDLFSWNSMLAACSKHQKCDAMELILRQQILEGFQPDQQSLEHFSSMLQDHYLQPVPEHYRCVLDLLGRAGLLYEAEALIQSMPFQPDEVAWKCLLSACNNHGDADRGATIAKQVLRSESGRSASYVLVSQTR